jgi:hypothetical protein
MKKINLTMKIVKIKASANLNLWPEMWRREWHFILMKMAETSWFWPFSAQTVFGPNCQNPLSSPIFSAQNDSALSNSAQRSTTSFPILAH